MRDPLKTEAITTGDPELKIVVDGGAYVFCYRPIGEFADR